MKRTFLSLVLSAVFLATALVPLHVGGYALTEQNKPLSREILTEGMVLLKNEAGVLPLKSTDRIAVFGSSCVYTGKTTDGFQIGGGGSSNVNPEYTPVDPLTALENAEKAGEISVYKPLAEAYRRDITYVPDEQMYTNACAATDKAIMLLSRYATEGDDRTPEKGDWYLSDDEAAMMKKLSSLYDDVIVLVNTGGAIDTSWAVGEVEGIDVEAVMLVWYPGSEGGNAIADLLLGRANPSGKLTSTFASHITDYPSDEGFDTYEYTDYTEDIYVGYRYFTTFDKKVNYPFGFGLSYTDFSLTNATTTADDTNITVTVTVTNTGSMSGKEVVQVYYGAPRLAEGSLLGNPKAELAGFAKTALLAPGESEQVSISFPIADMASFDDMGATGEDNRSAFVLEKGDYKIYVGTDVNDALEHRCGTYSVTETKKIEQLHAYVAPTALEKRLRDDGSYEPLPTDVTDTATKPKATETATRTTPKVLLTGRDVLAGEATIDEFLSQMDNTELVTFVEGHEGRVDFCCGSIGATKDVNDKYILPEIQTSDGPGGLRTGRKATAWGCETLVGCTWDPTLAMKMGEGIADEAIISYLDVWLAPGVNLHRHPLCGRNFEYYSEDPLVSGKMAAFAVRGAQSKGIYACIKHFAANEKEYNRNQNDSRVSQRALREMYLKPFEICIKEASPRFVMSSYNYLNGHEVAERHDLLTGILREEWGFDGVVTTDWYNDSDPVKELRAGVNVKMPFGYPNKLLTALKNEELTRAELINAIKPTISAILDSRKAIEISDQHISSDSITTVPAENCYRTDGKVYRNDYLLGIGYFDTRSHFIPCYLNYYIYAEATGYYRLSLKSWNESGKAYSDCVDVFVDDKICKGIQFENQPTNAYSNKECGIIYLTEGEHTLCIKIKNYLGRLDGVLFEPVEKPAVDPLTIVTLSYASDRTTIGSLPASCDTTRASTVTLPEASIKRDGYLFGGWSDGRKTYKPGDAFTVNEDTTFTAVWNTPQSADGFHYSFVSLPTYTGSLPADVHSEQNTLTIPSCSAAKDGYSLVGFTDGNRIYKIGDTVTSNGSTVLSAVWRKKDSDLSLLAFDGTRPDFDNKTLYASGSSTVKIVADPDDPEAYAYFLESYSGKYYSAFTYKNAKAGYPLKAGHTYDLTIEFFVTGINKNGTENTTETQATLYFNAEYDGKPHLIAHDTAEIGQWRTLSTSFTVDADMTASDNDSLTVYINPDTQNSSGFNYYLTEFNVIDRTSDVSFASKETCTGSLPASIGSAKGEEITLPMPDIAREGYSFDGWSDGKTTYKPGQTYTVTGNVTLYAVWVISGQVLTLTPGDALTDICTLSFKSITVANNPDNASERVFRTDNGIYISNAHGRLALTSGHTYKLTIDVRPDEARSFALFCNKDKSASPETFIYTGVGSAAAGVWTTLSTTFTMDTYNPIAGNTLQLQIQGNNTPYYFRNFALMDITPKTEYTISFASEGTLIGSLPKESTVKRGGSFTLPTCTATRPGYVFDLWMVGSTYYLPGSTITPTNDTTVRAVWLKQSVVFALRPERSYPDVVTFSKKTLSVAQNPDNTTEKVFRTDNGVYIQNTNGLLSLQAGVTYRLSFDIRPDNKISSLALFCNKDKSAIPESFLYKGIGSAEANVWTTISTEFTLDSYNNIRENTMQLQISGTNTPYYIRNLVLERIPKHTVSYTDKTGALTHIDELYTEAVTDYVPNKTVLGSDFYTMTADGKTQLCAVNTPVSITAENAVIQAYFPTEAQILTSALTEGGKTSVKLLLPQAGSYTVVFVDREANKHCDVSVAHLTAEGAGIHTVTSTKAIALGKGDKIILCEGLNKLIPQCEAFVVE